MKKIKEKIDAKIKIEKLSNRELILVGLVLLLGGILLGVALSPKGDRIFGSNNGNNNSGTLGDKDLLDTLVNQ